MDKVMGKRLAGSRSPGSKEERILMKSQPPPVCRQNEEPKLL